MSILLAATVTFRLVIMPIAALPGVKTPANSATFQPFDIDKSFTTENDCKSDFQANAVQYLQQRGFPFGTIANYSCTAQ